MSGAFSDPPPDVEGRPVPGLDPSHGGVPPGGAPPRPTYIQIALKKPFVTYAILGLTILVYLAQAASRYLYGIDLVGGLGVKANAAILQGQFWRLFTPMLLHGSPLHVGFNMYALYALGPTLESHYGRGRFLVLYLLAGFAGNVASFLFTSANSLGSSTAIFGLLGAFGVFLYQNRGILGSRARRGLGNIVTIALINLAIGLSPGIDNWGHVGGLAGGTLFAWLGGPRLKVEWEFPGARLEDQREASEVFLAGLTVGLIFVGMLAAALLARWF